MTFVVRSAQPSDESALIDQFQGLDVHENGITKDRRTDYSAAQESLAAAWQRVRQTDGQVLVAELDGRVIGHLFLLFKIDAVFVERELRPYAYISELYVGEKVRGRGLARALMNEAIAKQRGLPRILVGVVAGNKEAEALYGRLGYAPYTTELTKNL
jgi:GNAT superfamily N-acetyltransferase